MRKVFILITSLLFFNATFLKAQESVSVTLHLNEASIREFAASIESQSQYRFFYNTAQLDSLRFTVNVDKKPLLLVLDQVFANTGFRYSFYKESIYLIRGKAIVTELASQFLPGEKKHSENLLPKNEDAPYQTDTKAAVMENKLYLIGFDESNLIRTNATITGYIKSNTTGEPIRGATISTIFPKTSTTTDQNGFYALTLPTGKYALNIHAAGIRDSRVQIHLRSDGRFDIKVQEFRQTLNEVVISANKNNNISKAQMGVETLDIKTIKRVPTVFGEADILRVVLTLPGVKSVGESSTGFNVRGGSTDQNLILFNDATIYNPSHFFGFFSAFNAEIIKDVQLYKSSIPAKYGGRLSSVLELNAREGNKKKITGTAGLGLLTSRFNIEGPIIQDKTSLMLGGRTTYSNWILKALPEKAGYKNANATFSDLNINIDHQQNAKNSFYLTGYLSNDNSNLATDTSYAYSNKNLSMKWKHTFNDRLAMTTTAVSDNYGYQSYSNFNPEIGYRLKFNISQTNIKADFQYNPHPKHRIETGLQSIHYKLKPGEFKPFDDASLTVPDVLANEQARESAVYLEDNFQVSKTISINAGIRYSMFNNLGPGNVSLYAPNLPKEENNVLEVRTFGKGEAVKNYGGPEYRFSTRFAITPDLAIKASYNTLRQYIHMLSNTTSISPTDIWKLSDMNIKPQTGEQLSLGVYKNFTFNNNTIETSVETYYKRMHDFLDYKSGASLILNHNIEQDVVSTEGKAYGLEFMVKKVNGKLNGWVSYTYSRSLLKTLATSGTEAVNKGNYYPSNYDKPHDFTFIGNYKFTQRIGLSFNTTYSTGRPITLPISRYNYLGAIRVYYSERNQYRIPDYFRCDLAVNLDGNHKLTQRTHNSWTIGIYNITARKNAFATYFVSENGGNNGYKLSIFATAIPFINYNIRF